MTDDLPAPIGPDIEKIIARLYPPVVQELVETSENLMHKKITRIQLAIWSFIEARLQREFDAIRCADGRCSQETVHAAFRKLLRWAGLVKEQERQMIAAQWEEHRQRMRNILAWWDARQEEQG